MRLAIRQTFRSSIAATAGILLAAAFLAALITFGPAPDRAFAVVLCENATPSPAAGTVCLDTSDRNQTAAGFLVHGCDHIPGGQSATLDGWVFALPGSGGRKGASFTSLTLTFDTDPGPGVTEQVLTIPGAPNSGLINTPPNATSKAFIQTPAGWTLVDGQAQVTAGARQDFFDLGHTCPAAA